MIPFLKTEGTGNDFVVVDGSSCQLPADLAKLSRGMCNRHLGVGGDGLLVIEQGEHAPFRMRMFNPDGSESEMCGNGIRCFAAALRELGLTQEESIKIETGAGELCVRIEDPRSPSVNMGTPKLERGEIGMTPPYFEPFVDVPVGGGFLGTAVSMGNPHLVIFVEDVASIELERIGPIFEEHPFFPQRVNVHFAQVLDRAHVVQRTWERGAGITLACGTGACATTVAGRLTDRTESEVTVSLPGGKLNIRLNSDGTVQMDGPARVVFSGEFPT